jgi:putative redox protein
MGEDAIGCVRLREISASPFAAGRILDDMESLIRYQDGVKFEVSTRGHKLICDQPPSNGGADEGMTPPELLLASLGTCAGFYALQYLKTRSLATDGLEVFVTAEKAAQPARLGKFRIEVRGVRVEGRHREGLLRAVESCLIHNTLQHAPQVELVLEEAEKSA